MHQSRTYYPNLDGLRFICFLSVFFFHSFHTEYQALHESPIYEFVKRDIFGNGNLGVNFFFVLSGFLITGLLIEEKNQTGKINIVNFWARRILRIWPLYYFCVGFGFVIFPILKSSFGQLPNETANPLFYIFFISNFDLLKNGLPDASILGVLWSIAIEEQFYFVWPLLLAVVPVRYFKYIFGILLIISIGFRLVTINPEAYEYHTLSCMGDLVIGAIASLVAFNKKIIAYVKQMPRAGWFVLYALVAMVYFFRKEMIAIGDIWQVVERPLTALIFAMIILEQCFAENSFYKMGNFPSLMYLGTISYGLYCLHFLGILITTNATKILGVNTTLWDVLILETSLALFLTIGFAWFSYRFFESPFLALKNRFIVEVKTEK